MDESLVRFYVACITLALEYLHDSKIVYRDLKPENVFIDQTGYIKLGDFGFAKVLSDSSKTYTFCGTPGYVAPENILAHGYSYSVDWWGVGVLMYVLLTGRQPFSTPRTDDPMQVRAPRPLPMHCAVNRAGCQVACMHGTLSQRPLGQRAAALHAFVRSKRCLMPEARGTA